jgi:DNA modification methylase
LAERYEVILVFTRSADYVFNANAARIPQKQPDKRAYKGPKKGQLSGHPLGAHPTNVWDIGTVKNGSPDRKACGDHPAPFPVKLVKRLIMLYSMPGDVIGDPFCGSGSSCVGAIETGRSYTGADILYEDMRNERLSRVAPDLVSELTGVTDKSVAVWNAEARPITLDAIDKNAFMSENSIADLFGDAI